MWCESTGRCRHRAVQIITRLHHIEILAPALNCPAAGDKEPRGRVSLAPSPSPRRRYRLPHALDSLCAGLRSPTPRRSRRSGGGNLRFRVLCRSDGNYLQLHCCVFSIASLSKPLIRTKRDRSIARPSSTMHTRPCAARKRPRSFSLPFRQLLLVAVAATTGIVRTAQAFILPSSSGNQALRSAQVIRMGKGGAGGDGKKRSELQEVRAIQAKFAPTFFKKATCRLLVSKNGIIFHTAHCTLMSC